MNQVDSEALIQIDSRLKMLLDFSIQIIPWLKRKTFDSDSTHDSPLSPRYYWRWALWCFFFYCVCTFTTNAKCGELGQDLRNTPISVKTALQKWRRGPRSWGPMLSRSPWKMFAPPSKNGFRRHCPPRRKVVAIPPCSYAYDCPP